MAVSGFTSVSPPTDSTTTTIPQTDSPVTLIAANPARKGLTIHNAGTRSMVIKIGPGATSTLYSFSLLPRGTYTAEFPVYIGILTGVWVGPGGGKALVTEEF